MAKCQGKIRIQDFQMNILSALHKESHLNFGCTIILSFNDLNYSDDAVMACWDEYRMGDGMKSLR